MKKFNSLLKYIGSTATLIIYLSASNIAIANDNNSSFKDIMGVWTGFAHQKNTGTSWNIKMNFTKNKFDISYPSIPCSGKLTPLLSHSNKYIFQEKITKNQTKCVDNGILLLKKLDNNTLSWKWSEENGENTVVTTVKKQKQPTIKNNSTTNNTTQERNSKAGDIMNLYRYIFININNQYPKTSYYDLHRSAKICTNTYLTETPFLSDHERKNNDIDFTIDAYYKLTVAISSLSISSKDPKEVETMQKEYLLKEYDKRLSKIQPKYKSSLDDTIKETCLNKDKLGFSGLLWSKEGIWKEDPWGVSESEKK